ncbi:TraR/DksA C4-type zinc finger protein [Undibacterium sp. Xuan67W]|uniref:TraR/DksA C4-type zinc finger protein n=1 Tax=Undibacterium sp. Xuan67W TaxID=3413057 RepID=UPI003BF28B50
MTDFIDRATAQEEHARHLALQDQARRAGLAGKTVLDSNVLCSDCDEPIPMRRRHAMPGCQCCIDCQTRREQEFYQR